MIIFLISPDQRNEAESWVRKEMRGIHPRENCFPLHLHPVFPISSLWSLKRKRDAMHRAREVMWNAPGICGGEEEVLVLVGDPLWYFWAVQFKASEQIEDAIQMFSPHLCDYFSHAGDKGIKIKNQLAGKDLEITINVFLQGSYFSEMRIPPALLATPPMGHIRVAAFQPGRRKWITSQEQGAASSANEKVVFLGFDAESREYADDPLIMLCRLPGRRKRIKVVIRDIPSRPKYLVVQTSPPGEGETSWGPRNEARSEMNSLQSLGYECDTVSGKPGYDPELSLFRVDLGAGDVERLLLLDDVDTPLPNFDWRAGVARVELRSPSRFSGSGILPRHREEERGDFRVFGGEGHPATQTMRDLGLRLGDEIDLSSARAFPVRPRDLARTQNLETLCAEWKDLRKAMVASPKFEPLVWVALFPGPSMVLEIEAGGDSGSIRRFGEAGFTLGDLPDVFVVINTSHSRQPFEILEELILAGNPSLGACNLMRIPTATVEVSLGPQDVFRDEEGEGEEKTLIQAWGVGEIRERVKGLVEQRRMLGYCTLWEPLSPMDKVRIMHLNYLDTRFGVHPHPIRVSTPRTSFAKGERYQGAKPTETKPGVISKNIFDLDLEAFYPRIMLELSRRKDIKCTTMVGALTVLLEIRNAISGEPLRKQAAKLLSNIFYGHWGHNLPLSAALVTKMARETLERIIHELVPKESKMLHPNAKRARVVYDDTDGVHISWPGASAQDADELAAAITRALVPPGSVQQPFRLRVKSKADKFLYLGGKAYLLKQGSRVLTSSTIIDSIGTPPAFAEFLRKVVARVMVLDNSDLGKPVIPPAEAPATQSTPPKNLLQGIFLRAVTELVELCSGLLLGSQGVVITSRYTKDTLARVPPSESIATASARKRKAPAAGQTLHKRIKTSEQERGSREEGGGGGEDGDDGGDESSSDTETPASSDPDSISALRAYLMERFMGDYVVAYPFGDPKHHDNPERTFSYLRMIDTERDAKRLVGEDTWRNSIPRDESTPITFILQLDYYFTTYGANPLVSMFRNLTTTPEANMKAHIFGKWKEKMPPERKMIQQPQTLLDMLAVPQSW